MKVDIYNATIIAATIAAAAAVFGTFMNRHGQRAERKSEVYAGALRSMRDYQELPHTIWRRQDSQPSTEASLRQLAGAIYNDVQFHLQRLQIESPLVGQAYLDLFEQTRRQYRINRKIAWATPMSVAGVKPDEGPQFVGDNGPEIDLCLEAMRAEVSVWRLFRRPLMRRKLVTQRNRRQSQTNAPSA